MPSRSGRCRLLLAFACVAASGASTARGNAAVPPFSACDVERPGDAAAFLQTAATGSARSRASGQAPVVRGAPRPGFDTYGQAETASRPGFDTYRAATISAVAPHAGSEGREGSEGSEATAVGATTTRHSALAPAFDTGGSGDGTAVAATAAAAGRSGAATPGFDTDRSSGDGTAAVAAVKRVAPTPGFDTYGSNHGAGAPTPGFDTYGSGHGAGAPTPGFDTYRSDQGGTAAADVASGA